MQYLTQIGHLANLRNAFTHIAANQGRPGVDGVTLEQFAGELEPRLQQISAQLLSGKYSFQPLLSVPLSRQNRTISILTVADRLVVQAIHQVIRAPLEQYLHQSSYAYRPGRSAVSAALELEKALKTNRFPYVLRCDIYHFFDEVDHEILLRFLNWALGQEALATIRTIEQAVCAPELYEGQLRERRRGIPQGSSLSPLLSNLYLTPLDRYLERSGEQHLRFCDDLAILLSQEENAGSLTSTLQSFLQDYLHLSLHPEKTRLLSLAEGFDFLGFHFSPAGRRPGQKAHERLDQRLQQAPTADEKKTVRQRWQAYYGKEHGSETSSASAYPFLSVFSQLFRGNPTCFARAYNHGEHYGYTPIHRSLNEDDLLAHLLGKQTLGIFLLHENQVSCTCLDLDISKKTLADTSTDPGEFSDRVLQQARQAERTLSQWGFSPLLEESGRKGYHLWLFLDSPTPAQLVISFWRKVLEQIGPAPQGVQREIFPREAENRGRLGSLIKLPLGLHPASGRRSMFLDSSGEPIANPQELLTQVSQASPQALARRTEQAVSPTEKSPVQRLLDGCNVVRRLCEKAYQEKDLGHFERLILLQTLGQLGEEGEKALHQVIGQCYNYSQAYTQKQIEKKHPSPIGCRRIHEILGEALNDIEPCCTFDIPPGGYGSPVLHAFPQATRNLGGRKP